MSGAVAVAWREVRSLFLSPFGWVSLAVFQFVAAWLFLVRLDAYVQVQPRLATQRGAPGLSDLVVAPFFAQGAMLLLLLTPLLTMRLVSGERQSGTLPLLFSAPLTLRGIVVGKFLGAALFCLLLVALLAAMPVALYAGSTLDTGQLLAGVLGLVLLQVALVAIGTLMSCLAGQPAAAAVGSVGTMLLLWFADLGRVDDTAGVLTWLSLSEHLRPFLRGLVDSADIAYFGLVTVLCLVLSVQRLAATRRG